jgi:hypothetical protein
VPVLEYRPDEQAALLARHERHRNALGQGRGPGIVGKTRHPHRLSKPTTGVDDVVEAKRRQIDGKFGHVARK